MAGKTVEQVMRLADSLNEDELLEVAQKLIQRAQASAKNTPNTDVNALAGTLDLNEDPMAIQERMRREWE